jgi:hypothetical protein
MELFPRHIMLLIFNLICYSFRPALTVLLLLIVVLLFPDQLLLNLKHSLLVAIVKLDEVINRFHHHCFNIELNILWNFYCLFLALEFLVKLSRCLFIYCDDIQLAELLIS